MSGWTKTAAGAARAAACGLAALLLALWSLSGLAPATDTRNILVLFSYEAALPATQEVTHGLFSVPGQTDPHTNRIFIEYADAGRVSRLPADTQARFWRPTVWEQYWLHILTAGFVIALQSLLLIKFQAEAGKRRAAEASLAQTQARIDMASSAVDLGLWDWDAKSGRIWISKTCGELLRIGADGEIDFVRFLESLHPEDVERARFDLDGALSLAVPFDAQYRLRPENGPIRWLEFKGVPVGDGNARLAGVAIDVTERREAQAQADMQRQELAHLSRASVVGALSGALAHEINQPLTAILSNAQAALRMIKSGRADPAELQQILQDIMQDDKRAGDVIRHLRALLKKGDAVKQDVNINDVVMDAVKLAGSTIALRSVTVTTRLAMGLPRIEGDPIQLQQVVLNFLLNACEAMSSSPPGQRQLGVVTRQGPKGKVQVAVSDTGAGLSEEALARVFEPFFTTKDMGLGLGLSICHWIVSAHGGRCWAENNPERGATFTFEL